MSGFDLKYIGELRINRYLDRSREFEDLSYGEKHEFIDGMIESLQRLKVDLVEEEKDMAREAY